MNYLGRRLALMANQTIISVPTKFEEFKQVRAFAIKLVEQLDIVLGYRGNDGYQTETDAADTTELTLTSIAATAFALEAELDAVVARIDATENDINTIQQGTSISDTSYTAPTRSAGYVQAEAQGVADDLETVSDKLDTLLGVLRSAGILT